MAEKPSYAELEQTVKKLENEAAKRKRAEKALDRQRSDLIFFGWEFLPTGEEFKKKLFLRK